MSELRDKLWFKVVFYAWLVIVTMMLIANVLFGCNIGLIARVICL